MIIIADSSSLILLTKAELLTSLAKKTKLIIPRKVYSEAVEEGLKKNFTDAIKIKKLVDDKKIAVKEADEDREFPVSLGKGEKEALELFYQEKADKVIVDDKKALNLCKIIGIPYTTVHMILTDLLRKKIIDKKQALRSLDILSVEGRYSSKIILYYYNLINKVK